MVITVLAYRPSGANYCRGCEMERWGSDFEFHVFSDDGVQSPIADAVPVITKYLRYGNYADEYGSYQITLLLDGQEFYCYSGDNEQDKNHAITKKLLDDAKALAEHQRAAEKAAKLAAKVAKEAAEEKRRKDQRETSDRQEYLRFKAKYEGKGDSK